MTERYVFRTVVAAVVALATAQHAVVAKEYSYRPASVSFFPPLSTNGIEAGDVSSSFSLNMIGGYLGRLSGIELGGVFNIELDDALGYQAAGAANVVGGNFTGVQQAGAVGIVGGDVRILQQAGAVSVAGGSVIGVQMAGAVSVAGGGVTGAQVSGAVNLAGGRAHGLQMAGAVNIANEFSGAQIGVVNIAGEGRGLQLGVVNIADDVDVPIGLVSIVRNGQFHVNVWASEASLVNVGVKTGSRAIYNVFALGLQPAGDSTLLMAGLGIGGHVMFAPFFLDIDATGYNVYSTSDWFVPEGLDLLSKLSFTGGWQVNDFLAVTAGPTANVWVSDREDGSAIPLYDAPIFRYEGNPFVRIWPGFTIGIQLL